jgi:hypothetical protein
VRGKRTGKENVGLHIQLCIDCVPELSSEIFRGDATGGGADGTHSVDSSSSTPPAADAGAPSGVCLCLCPCVCLWLSFTILKSPYVGDPRHILTPLPYSRYPHILTLAQYAYLCRLQI